MAHVATSKFSVQAFRSQGKELVPEAPQLALDEEQALRKVERAAEGKAGAVAIRQDGDPALGEFEEPIVLKVIGRVPYIYQDIPF